MWKYLILTCITTLCFSYATYQIQELGPGLVTHTYHKESKDLFSHHFHDGKVIPGHQTQSDYDTYVVDITRNASLKHEIINKKYKGNGFSLTLKDNDPALSTRHIVEVYYGATGFNSNLFKYRNIIANSLLTMKLIVWFRVLVALIVVYGVGFYIVINWRHVVI